MATNEEIRELLITKHSPTRSDLMCIDIKWPPKKGWKKEMMARVEMTDADIFRERKKRGMPQWGFSKKNPEPKPEVTSDIMEVVRKLASDMEKVKAMIEEIHTNYKRTV